MSYRIVVTPRARGMLKAITDRRIREKLASVIDSLESDPSFEANPSTTISRVIAASAR